LESHCQIASLTCQGSLDDLNFSQTQSSVIPEESASGLHSVANVPATLYAQHGTKVMMIAEKGKKKGETTLHFKCNYYVSRIFATRIFLY
jgi:hypothetical protein